MLNMDKYQENVAGEIGNSHKDNHGVVQLARNLPQ